MAKRPTYKELEETVAHFLHQQQQLQARILESGENYRTHPDM
jgi:hypothetical protein